jgi:hypothetical protein
MFQLSHYTKKKIMGGKIDSNVTYIKEQKAEIRAPVFQMAVLSACTIYKK